MSSAMRWLGRWLAVGLLAGGCGAWAQTVKTPAEKSAAVTVFDVVSVRPSPCDGLSMSSPDAVQFTARHASMGFLLQYAFDMNTYQLEKVPQWANDECYDIVGTGEGSPALSYEMLQPMLQHLLMERFKLVVHREQKEIAGYVLVVAQGGAKLTPAKGGAGMGALMPDGLRVDGVEAGSIAAMLSHSVDRPVVDRTGLSGTYDVHLKFAPTGSMNSTLPSIFTAVQEQLGLKLEPQKVTVHVLVIDHVEKTPTEN